MGPCGRGVIDEQDRAEGVCNLSLQTEQRSRELKGAGDQKGARPRGNLIDMHAAKRKQHRFPNQRSQVHSRPDRTRRCNPDRGLDSSHQETGKMVDSNLQH